MAAPGLIHGPAVKAAHATYEHTAGMDQPRISRAQDTDTDGRIPVGWG